ncbi:uncharacterized protein PRCAT00000019001 [Priceomyces carsonii]|uniref:uncharacterized protein n=1 Tax=Priceomyces carsonii TaxID=28549 RepID=UPI002ED9E3F3|nr:unnamed protein product [Priceomyces carsonii]
MLDEMEPESKRRRVRQACNPCRNKRAKCDGVKPVCSTCRETGSTCTYSITSKKRGLKTGYLHDVERKKTLLEAILGFLISDVNESTEIEKSIFKTLSVSEKGEELLGRLSEYQLRWTSSPLYELFDKLVSENELLIHIPNKNRIKKEEDDSQRDEISVHNDMERGWKPEVLQYHGISGLVSGFSQNAIQEYNRKLASKETSPFRVGSIFHVRPNLKVVNQPPAIFFPLDSRILIDAYFQVLHPWLPMINRIHLIRYIHHTAEMNNSKGPNNPDLNTIALIWTVLAIGQYIIDVNDNSSESIASKYASNAISALEGAGDSTLETIQAMLLLGYYHYCAGAWGISWVLTSSAARMATDVRLMKPDTEGSTQNNNVPVLVFDDSSRERTWAVAFTLNTLLAARMGRSPVIRALDWPEVQIFEDGWEEWDSWDEFGRHEGGENPLHIESARCLSTFNLLLNIVSILNLSITSIIDTTGINDSLSTPNVITFEHLQKKLKDLKNTFPNYCQLKTDASTEEIQKLPHYIIFAHLAYHLTLCITAVRLSEVEVLEGYKYSRMERNKFYTEGAYGIKHFLSSMIKRRLLYVPYLDYFTSMCLSSGQMLTSGSNPDTFTQYAINVLKEAPKLLNSCRIAQEMIEIEGRMKTNSGTNFYNYPNTLHKFTSTLKSIDENLEISSFHSSLQSSCLSLFPNEISGHSSTSFNSGQNKSKSFDYDELDVFMLDTDSPENNPRKDKFLKNLGYVGGTKKNWTSKYEEK